MIVNVRKLAVLGGVAAVLMAGGACSSSGTQETSEPSPTPSVGQRWLDQIDGLLASSEASEAEHNVLADHWVSDAELAQAADVYKACMRTYGLEGVTDGDIKTGTFGFGTSRESQVEFQDAAKDKEKAHAQVPRIEDKCSEEASYLDIASYYYQMRSNPENKTFIESLQEALIVCKVADVQAMSGAEFAEAIEDASWMARPEIKKCYDAFLEEITYVPAG